jgi:glycosyltransferase involved in cell wall biosynthesis
MANQKLKIAVVLRLFSPNGGLELYALKLVEGLLASGHQITVICEKDESGLSHPNLTVHTFSPPPRKYRKGERLDYYLGATSKAVAALGSFDIIHSHHFPVEPVDVVTFHNHTAGRLSQVGYQWERILNNAKMTFTQAYQARHNHDGKLARLAKMRIFVGGVMKDDFYTAYSLPEDAPYTVAHPGASLNQSADKSKRMVTGPDADAGGGANADAGGGANANAGGGANGHDPCDAEQSDSKKDKQPFTFLFVGKGFRKKGLDTLLSACRLLKERGHDFELHIAGIKATPAWEFHRKIFDLPIKYLGFRRDMHNVYAGCQVIILPSKIEPFGMAPIQGMQFGLVPIVSRVCGVAEVLTDGQDALILNNHLDKHQLADLMERLLVDRELYKRLTSQAKAKADELNWQQTVEATEKAYKQVMEDRRAGPASAKF